MTRPSATDRAARSARAGRSRAVVASRLPAARALGRRLGARLTDPEGFERLLARGLRQLADPGHQATQARRAPGARGLLGVRQPLLAAIARQVGRRLDGASPALALYLADRLTRSADHEARLLAVPILGHSLRADPERSWQLVRRIGRAASEPMTVDALAGLVATGVQAEPYRWAELEQLAYATSPWERRLVGSALARLAQPLPHDEGRALAIETDAPRSLSLCRQLMGDPEAGVQEALARALRTWSRVAPAAAGRFVEAETEIAVATGDGNRAWVLRAAGAGLDARLGAQIRIRLRGLRRAPQGPDTSAAAAAVAAFAAGGFRLPDPGLQAEPPLALAGSGGPTVRSLAR